MLPFLRLNILCLHLNPTMISKAPFMSLSCIQSKEVSNIFTTLILIFEWPLPNCSCLSALLGTHKISHRSRIFTLSYYSHYYTARCRTRYAIGHLLDYDTVISRMLLKQLAEGCWLHTSTAVLCALQAVQEVFLSWDLSHIRRLLSWLQVNLHTA